MHRPRFRTVLLRSATLLILLIPLFGAGLPVQGEPTGTLLPLWKTAVSSQLTGWESGKLMDANLNSSYSSQPHGEHLASSEWIAVAMPARTNVDKVRVLPRYGGGPALGFPKDFVLQYAWNGDGHTCNGADPHFAELTNWLPMVSLFGYSQPKSGWVEFTSPPVQAGCVRLLGTELSQDDYGYRYLQLAELELYAGASRLGLNSVASSSALSGWPASNAADGNPATAFSSANHGEHLASSEYAALILPYQTTVDKVLLYPRYSGPALGFPKDFVVQYSWEGNGHTCHPEYPNFAELSNWQPMASLFGYSQPKSGWVEINTNPVQAGCVRILGTELSQDDYGYRYLQLGEMQVYGTPITGGAIRGRVTSGGSPRGSDIRIGLQFYNGSSWSTYAIVPLQGNGTYTFNPPALAPGQSYQVVYADGEMGNVLDPGYLNIFASYLIKSYTAQYPIPGGDFDIANFTLSSPPDAAYVNLPQAFWWNRRSATTWDSYGLYLVNPGNLAQSALLPTQGYSDNYTLTSLPSGFASDAYYVWQAYIRWPDGSMGISNQARWIRFYSTGTAMSEDLSALGPGGNLPAPVTDGLTWLAQMREREAETE